MCDRTFQCFDLTLKVPSPVNPIDLLQIYMPMVMRGLIRFTEHFIPQSVNYGARREGVGAPGFRTTSHVVTSVTSEGCGAYSRATWVQKPLVIPPVPASGLEGCSFIDIKYYIKVDIFINSYTYTDCFPPPPKKKKYNLTFSINSFQNGKSI